MAEHTILKVSYDPALVTPGFMADHVGELEGVESIEIEEASDG